MALRIHFTLEDLGRTRVAPAIHPLQELSIALRVRQNTSPPPRLAAWRRETAARLPAAAQPAFELTPAHGWVPDFLAPTAAGEPEELLEQIRATPRRRLRREMADAGKGMSGFGSQAGHATDDRRAAAGPPRPRPRGGPRRQLAPAGLLP